MRCHRYTTNGINPSVQTRLVLPLVDPCLEPCCPLSPPSYIGYTYDSVAWPKTLGARAQLRVQQQRCCLHLGLELPLLCQRSEHPCILTLLIVVAAESYHLRVEELPAIKGIIPYFMATPCCYNTQCCIAAQQSTSSTISIKTNTKATEALPFRHAPALHACYMRPGAAPRPQAPCTANTRACSWDTSPATPSL